MVNGSAVLYKGELVPEDEVPAPCVGEAYEVCGASGFIYNIWGAPVVGVLITDTPTLGPHCHFGRK